jgi:hypothetical protein
MGLHLYGHGGSSSIVSSGNAVDYANLVTGARIPYRRKRLRNHRLVHPLTEQVPDVVRIADRSAGSTHPDQFVGDLLVVRGRRLAPALLDRSVAVSDRPGRSVEQST